jgi:hypothetical protein
MVVVVAVLLVPPLLLLLGELMLEIGGWLLNDMVSKIPPRTNAADTACNREKILG